MLCTVHPRGMTDEMDRGVASSQEEIPMGAGQNRDKGSEEEPSGGQLGGNNGKSAMELSNCPLR